MDRGNKIMIIAMTLLVGIVIQVMFAFLEKTDTPNKAVTEFVKAYVSYDGDTMAQRMSDGIRTVDDVDVVKSFVYEETKKARDRGFGLFYLSDCLYHVRTYTLEKEAKKAKVRLVCERKGWLRSFFTGESDTIDQTFEVVWVQSGMPGQGIWKINKTELL